jgi:hypothetical protein
VNCDAAGLELVAELGKLLFREVVVLGQSGQLGLVDLAALLGGVEVGGQYVFGAGVQRISFLVPRLPARRRRRSNLSIRPPVCTCRSRPV